MEWKSIHTQPKYNKRREKNSSKGHVQPAGGIALSVLFILASLRSLYLGVRPLVNVKDELRNIKVQQK